MAAVFGQELLTGDAGLEAGGSSKQKKMPTATSLLNLKHNKKCPKCPKVHGNAKRGKCAAVGADGVECDYVFVVNSKRAKTADIESANVPTIESLPSREKSMRLRQISHKFKELRTKANALAVETGWSVFVMAGGALHEGPKPSKSLDSDPFIQTFPVDTGGPELTTLKVAVLRHGTGGAGKALASNTGLVQTQARMTYGNLKKQLLPNEAVSASGMELDASALLGPLAPAASPGKAGMDAILAANPAALTTNETLDQFMTRMDAAKYVSALRNEDIQMRDMLTCIGEDDLTQLGMPLGPRKRIINEIRSLRAAAARSAA